MYYWYCVIKTHGSVSCGPRSWRATPVSILTGRTKTSFSHICISVITYLIGTKFATQLPASQGSLHSKFEGNRFSHFRDTSCQSFVFFLRFFFLLLLRLFAHLQKLLLRIFCPFEHCVLRIAYSRIAYCIIIHMK